jgi:hypothetical protein
LGALVAFTVSLVGVVRDPDKGRGIAGMVLSVLALGLALLLPWILRCW